MQLALSHIHLSTPVVVLWCMVVGIKECWPVLLMLNNEPDVVVLHYEMFMEAFQLLLSMWPDNKSVVHV